MGIRSGKNSKLDKFEEEQEDLPQILDLNQQTFSSLIDIFDAIDIHEKGIENVYHYLLNHQTIEDIKTCSEELALPIKRVYKIFSVLKDLGLVQVYDRPMKIILNPPINSWETIISNRINELRSQVNEKVQLCENALTQMIEAYNLKPVQPSLPPVEFLSFNKDDEDSIDYLLNQISADKELLLAKGIKYENPLMNKLYLLKKEEKLLNNLGYKSYSDLIQKWYIKTKDIEYYAIFSQEYLDDCLQIIENLHIDEKVYQIFDSIKIDQNHIQIKVIEKSFSNFIVKDNNELLQFSVDPNNVFLGIFVSRQKEIIEVFRNKFFELSKNAIFLNEYLKKNNIRQLRFLDIVIIGLI